MWDIETKSEKDTCIYWCKHCNTPVIRTETQEKKCPLCQNRIKKLTTDLRPVFPAERALVELLTGENIKNKPVWKGRVAYYVDGKTLKVSNKTIIEANIEQLRKELTGKKYDYSSFNEDVNRFIDANREHLDVISKEAKDYICEEAKDFDQKDIIILFSGGKDSTVTANLVVKALPKSKIKHVFGDTTLEHDLTIKYVNRLKKNKNIEVVVARNNDNDFYKVAEQIGPPSRMSRWCCYMFKTGAVNRVMNELFGNKHILSFYGIRKNESLTRSKYNRTEDKAEHKKITNQRVCSPIFYWNEFEIWLYILANKIDFNDAYKLGYSRVGCWCCPNASDISELLAKVYLSKKYDKWHKFLVNFAKGIGKDEPENYVKAGAWKSRQGGQGLAEAKTVKLVNQNCTVQENGKIYDLIKPITKNFYELFIPFGQLIEGDSKIKETIVLDCRTNLPIISIQPLNDYKVKIVTLNVKGHHLLHTNISHQIVKHNACKQCLKCEGVCNFNAIKIDKTGYSIDATKCKHCQMCVSSKYIAGGCLMCRYLRTKKDAE